MLSSLHSIARGDRIAPGRVLFASAVVALACGPRPSAGGAGTGDGPGTSNTDAGDGVSVSSTSSEDAGDTAATACAESPFPAPYCFREYDVSGSLDPQTASFGAIGQGRIGLGDELGALFARGSTRSDAGGIQHVSWSAVDGVLVASPIYPSPEGLSLPNPVGAPFDQVHYMVAGIGPTHEALFVASAGTIWRFVEDASGFDVSSSTAMVDGPSGAVQMSHILTHWDLDGTGIDAVVDIYGRVWQPGARAWTVLGRLPDEADQPNDAPYLCSVKNIARSLDIEGDGRQDLVFVGSLDCDPRVRALSVVHNVTGTFDGLRASYLAWPYDHVDILQVGDFDGDQKTDILVGSYGARAQLRPTVLAAFMSRGDGTFEPPIHLLDRERSSASYAATVQVVDLDGDGIDEVTLAALEPSATWVLTQIRDGGSLHDLAGSALYFDVIADLDGDGRFDLLSHSSFSLFISEAP